MSALKPDSEKYTLYVTSNDADNTKTIVISKSKLKAFALLGFIFFIILIGTLLDYINLNLESPIHNKVRTEHQYLITNLQYVESELRTLEDSLKKVKKLTNKIEIINDYYNQGPISMISTTTEIANDDLVAKEVYKNTSPEYSLKKEELVKTASLFPNPLIDSHFWEDKDKLSVDTMSDRIELAVQDSEVLEHKVLQLWENLSERQNFLRATPSVKPARGWFSSRFGIRADPFTGRPTMHSGLDIAGSSGTTIYATADGVVINAGWRGGYGNLITIDHGYGIRTRYAHLRKAYVQPGQTVKRYDRIGAMGNTGRSTSTHLHYEVRVRGVAVDPINYILNF